MEPSKPSHTLRYGAVQATIWENTSDALKKSFFSVTLIRRYRAGEEWKESRSFTKSDLPTVAKIASDAHTWIDAESKRRKVAGGPPSDQPRRPRSKPDSGTRPLDLG